MDVEELYRRYADRVYNTVLRVVGDAEDAMDVTQETFLRAHRGSRSFRGSSSAYTWLFRIALNCAYTHLKRRKKSKHSSFNPNHGDEENEVAVEDCSGRNGFAVAEESERASIVQNALLRLPEELRMAVVLRDIEGLGYEEIAEVTDCPPGTAKSRVHRGRELLKNILKKSLKVEESGEKG